MEKSVICKKIFIFIVLATLCNSLSPFPLSHYYNSLLKKNVAPLLISFDFVWIYTQVWSYRIFREQKRHFVTMILNVYIMRRYAKLETKYLTATRTCTYACAKNLSQKSILKINDHHWLVMLIIFKWNWKIRFIFYEHCYL